MNAISQYQMTHVEIPNSVESVENGCVINTERTILRD
jgi:hypothetical protein